MKSSHLIFSLIFLILTFGLASASEETVFFQNIVPLYEAKKDPGPTDWMAVNQEEGQSFSDFTTAQLNRPTKEKPYIYIALLGDFNETQKKTLVMTGRYIESYFQTPVKFGEPVPLNEIPAKARRIHPQTGDPQILTTYVIEKVLIPRMPKDAFCYITFTSSDLWPGEGWNFVFGQASIEDRVGVWSLYRNGDAEKDFKLYLRRTIQTGTHEIGHLFGLHHCIYYECNMNGSNSRHESDLRPLWDCPVCLRKLAFSTNMDILKRYRDLASLCREYGFVNESAFFEDNLKAMKNK